MGLGQKIVDGAKLYRYWATGDVLGDEYRAKKLPFLISLSVFEGSFINARFFHHYHNFTPKWFAWFARELLEERLVTRQLSDKGEEVYQISERGKKLIEREADGSTLGLSASKHVINDLPLMALIGGYQHPGIVPNNPLSWAPSDPAIKRLVDKGLARINGRADSVESNLELTRYGYGLLSSQGYTKIENWEGWDMVVPSNKPLNWIAQFNHRRGLARAGDVEIAQRLLVTMFVLAKSKGSARLTGADLGAVIDINHKTGFKASRQLEDADFLTFLPREEEPAFEVTLAGQEQAERLRYLPPLSGPQR